MGKLSKFLVQLGNTSQNGRNEQFPDTICHDGITVEFDFTEDDYKRAEVLATKYNLNLMELSETKYNILHSYCMEYQRRYFPV